MFVWVYLQMVAPKTRTGQEASPWVTEGLTLAKCRSLLKADAFTFRYFGGCESTKFILVEELRSVLSLFWTWEMTPKKPDEFTFRFPHFFFSHFVGEITLPWFSVEKVRCFSKPT